MLAIISPAKKMDFSPEKTPVRGTQPWFQGEAQGWVTQMQAYRVAQLKHLMKISDKLARQNHERFQTFSDTPSHDQVKSAVMAFQGDVYRFLDVRSLAREEQRFLSQHALILSGLYGVLRPFDFIQPYRLEMGLRLTNAEGEGLLPFWRAKIMPKLNRLLGKEKNPTLLNLASNEYAAAVVRDALAGRFLDIQFKVKRAGAWKIIGVEAKRARGALLRYWVQHGFENPEDLKAFVWQGYRYHTALSEPDCWVWAKPD